MLLTLILYLTVATVTSKYSPECYKQSSKQYGNVFGTQETDLTALASNSDKLTLQHRITKINTCVDDDPSSDGAITGIRLVLGDGNRENDFPLETFGSTKGACSTFNMPDGATVTTLQIAHDGYRITSVSFITSTGDFRIIGYSDNTSQVAKYSFPAGFPLIGFYGSSTTKIQSLGAIAFMRSCDPTTQMSSDEVAQMQAEAEAALEAKRQADIKAAQDAKAAADAKKVAAAQAKATADAKKAADKAAADAKKKADAQAAADAKKAAADAQALAEAKKIADAQAAAKQKKAAADAIKAAADAKALADAKKIADQAATDAKKKADAQAEADAKKAAADAKELVEKAAKDAKALADAQKIAEQAAADAKALAVNAAAEKAVTDAKAAADAIKLAEDAQALAEKAAADALAAADAKKAAEENAKKLADVEKLAKTFTPDAPLNVSRNNITTTFTQIGITWVPGYPGSSPIIDFRVSYNFGTTDWPVLASGLTTTSYIKTNLISGKTYHFRVEARNAVGYSGYSSVATIICAQVPDAPINLKNDPAITNETTIGLNWTPGSSDGGSEIIDYRISYSQSNNNYIVLQFGVSDTFYSAKELQIGQSYKFKIEARNAVGYSQYSSESFILCAGVPDAPIAVAEKTQETSDVQISITWQEGASNGGSIVTSYQVWYDQANKNWKIIAPSVATRSFIAKGLNPGATYAFKVQSRNQVGLSQTSTPILILAATVPNAPVSVQNNAVITEEGIIGLQWLDAYDGSSSILDYRISYDSGIGTTVIITVTQKSYIASGLTSGQTYNFKIQARNMKGFSDYSNPVSIICARIPDPPTSLTSNFFTSNDIQIGLRWADGVSNGGSSIIDYKVQYTKGGIHPWIAASAAQQSFTAAGLEPGNLYSFRVQSRNQVGFSLVSDTISILAARIPDAPVIQQTKGWPENIKLSWTDGVYDGGSNVIDYRVSYDQGNGEFVVLAEQVIVKSFTAQGLETGVTYTFKIQARNEKGYGDYSEPVEILCPLPKGTLTTVSNSPPDAPTSLKASIFDGQIILIWADGAQDGGLQILDYQVSYDQGQNIWNVLQSNIISKQYKTTGFSFGKTYQFRVQSRNSVGLSYQSSAITVLLAELPDAPIQLQATIISDGSISISWADGAFDGGLPIIDYQVSYDQGSDNWSVLSKSVIFKSYTANGLSLGKTYQLQVQSRNSVGLSAKSESVTILLARPPDAPTYLEASTQTDVLITLTWKNGTSNGGLPVLDYQVSFDQGHNIWRFLPDTFIVQSFTLSGLTPGKTYQFRVRARNAIGYSPDSSSLSVLAAKIPDPPVNILATLIDLNTISLSWSQGKYNGGSSVKDYTISQDNGTNTPMTLASGVVGTSYTATNLTSGLTYKFIFQARNQIGLSLPSLEAIILCARAPDAPNNLQNIPLVTSDVKIGLTWADGLSDGGLPILDYLVTWQQAGKYENLAIARSTKHTLLDLTPGKTYSFKVQSRNAAGLSEHSLGVQILAARIPDAPVSISSFFCFNQGTKLSLKWSEGLYNGGSDVIDYSLLYSHAGGSFIPISSGIQDTNFIAKGLTSGQEYKFKVKSRNIVGLSDPSAIVSAICKPIPADSFGQPIQVNENPDQKEETSNLVPIIAGTVGGLVSVGVIVGIVVFILEKKKTESTKLPVKTYILGSANQALDESHIENSGVKLVASQEEDIEAQQVGTFQVEFERSQLGQPQSQPNTDREIVNRSELFEHLNLINVTQSKKVSSKKSEQSSWSLFEQSIKNASFDDKKLIKSDSGKQQSCESRVSQNESLGQQQRVSKRSEVASDDFSKILSHNRAESAKSSIKILELKVSKSLKKEGKKFSDLQSQIQVNKTILNKKEISEQNLLRKKGEETIYVAQLSGQNCELTPKELSEEIRGHDPFLKIESEVKVEVKDKTQVDDNKQVQMPKKREFNSLQQQEVADNRKETSQNMIYEQIRVSPDYLLHQTAIEVQPTDPISNEVLPLDQVHILANKPSEKQSNLVKTYQNTKISIGDLSNLESHSITPVRGSIVVPIEPVTRLVVREQQIFQHEYESVKGNFFKRFAEPEQEIEFNQLNSEWTPRQLLSQEFGIISEREQSLQINETEISPMKMTKQSNQESQDFNQMMNIQQVYTKGDPQALFPDSQQFSLNGSSQVSFNQRISMAEIVDLSNGVNTKQNLSGTDGYAEEDTKISNLRSNDPRSTISRFAEAVPDAYYNNSDDYTCRSFKTELMMLQQTKKQAEKDVKALEQQIIEDRTFKRRSTLQDEKKKKLEVKNQLSDKFSPNKNRKYDSSLYSHRPQSDARMMMISDAYSIMHMHNNFTQNEPAQPFVTRTQLFDVDLNKTHVHKYQTKDYLKRDFIDQEWVDTLQGREKKKKEQNKDFYGASKKNKFFQSTMNPAKPDEQVKLGEGTIIERSISPIQDVYGRAKSQLKYPSGFVRLNLLDPTVRVEAQRLNITGPAKRAYSNQR